MKSASSDTMLDLIGAWNVREPAWVLVGVASILVLVLRAVTAWPVPQFDEAALFRAMTQGWPTVSDGLLSALLARLTGSEAVLRGLAVAVFIGGHLLLVGELVPSVRMRLVLLAAIILTPWPFLWLSSELFASGFLALTFWSLCAGNALSITSLFLTAFAFSKPDLLVSALTLSAIYAWTTRQGWPARCRAAGALLFWWPVLLLPGLLLRGWASVNLETRSWVSFSQHYAAMVAPLQVVPGPNPWLTHPFYAGPAWHGARSVLTAILSDPSRYFDMLALSVSYSLKNLLWAGLIPIAVVVAMLFRSIRQKHWAWWAVAPFVGLVPQLALSYVHVRYLPRYLTCLVMLLALASSDPRNERRIAWAVGLTVLWLLPITLLVWQTGYWFPD